MGVMRAAPGRRGFTLVEVLVALLIMAILAALAWQGLDVIVRARDGSGEMMDRTLRLNTAVTQWEQDLQAVQDVGAVPALAFDGQSLRLTRRVDGGVALVVWAVRSGVWQRWASTPLRQAAELNETWLRSQQFLGNEPGQLTVAEASEWQLYFYVGNAWANAQSTRNMVEVAGPVVAPAAPPPASAGSGAQGQNAGLPGGTPPQAPPPAPTAVMREALPAAVRMVITLGGQVLTRDIALGPAGG